MELKGRISSLDGFRAVSIVLVICSHLVLSQTLPVGVMGILEQISFGLLGVRIFFVISGFLITYFLLKEREQTGRIDLKLFYLRRFLRIFPAFYVYLLLLSILNIAMDLQIPFLLFLGGGLYIQNFNPWGENWFIAHSWSLAVEEQFYLIWPLLFIRVKNVSNSSVWILGLIFGGLMRSFHYKYPGLSEYFLAPFFMYADFLFSGCCMAFLYFYNKDRLVQFINNTSSFFVYFSILALWFFSKFEFHPTYDKIFIPTSGIVVNVCICFLLSYFVIKEKSYGYKLLNSRIAIIIGQLSYSLYIWQQFFLSKYSANWFFQFPQNILFTFAAATASYAIVEKPFLKLKERFKPISTQQQGASDPV